MTIGFQDALQDALAAHYTLERELGGGGMSRVFLATEKSLGRQVVVKVLPPVMAAEMSVERFRREIQLAAQLQDAHIVPLLAAGEAVLGHGHGTRAPLPYYTMPFIRGETLRERLTRVGPLPVADAVSIMRNVATALAAAHHAGIIHRDIKPENVLLTEHDALVVDFGVSKALTAAAHEATGLTSAGMALGTPAYMAPEQATADPHADHRVDLYALGLLAYEMLAGSAPFVGRTPHATIAAHVAEVPESVAKRRSGVPASLAALVMRCLEKDPANRPQSADDVIDALDAMTSGARVVDTEGAGAVSDVRHTNRKALGIAATIAAIALAAIVGVVVWRVRTPPPLVDGTAVAVLPFRTVGGNAATRALSEGVPDLVAAKLTGRLHAVDVRTVLSAWRRAGGSETNALAREDAIALAKRVGAGAVVDGSVVVTGNDLLIDGTLLRADGQHDGRASVRGAATAFPVLLDSLVGKLLLLDAGETDERASRLAGVPFDALQGYLAGRAFERAGRYRDALVAYERAVTADSTFALAALRYWLTSSNWASSPRTGEMKRRAARHADRLSARDLLLLGDPKDVDRPRSCAETFHDQERGVSTAPDMPDLWYQLGETLAHCGSAMGLDDGPRRALGAFEHVLALDSTYTAAYDHYPTLYAVLGDSVNAVRFDTTLARTATGDVRGLIEFFSYDSTLRRKGRDALTTAPLGIALQVVGPALQFREGVLANDVEPVLAHLQQIAVTSEDRARVEDRVRGYALSRGQPTRAARVMRANPAGPDPAFALLAATFWDGDSSLVPAALAAARKSAIATPDSATETDWTARVFALGAYAAARGDVAEADRAIAALRALPSRAGTPWSNARARRFALVLDAQAAQLAHRPTAPTLLAAADSMLREAPGGLYVETAGNLIVSALWERAGDVPRAYAAVRRERIGTAVNFAESTWLRERGRLGALAGDREHAIAAYRTYLAVRAVAEPSFAPHLASVRAELAKLERGSAGK